MSEIILTTAKQIANAKYRLRYPERVKASNLKWRTENPEKVKAISHSQNIKHKDRINARRKATRSLNPDKERNKLYLERYGITLEDYNDMLVQQNELCFICEKHIKLYVDHDHVTGMVRGLLCRKCNSALGMLQDDLNNVIRATEYLRRYNG